MLAILTHAAPAVKPSPWGNAGFGENAENPIVGANGAQRKERETSSPPQDWIPP